MQADHQDPPSLLTLEPYVDEKQGFTLMKPATWSKVSDFFFVSLHSKSRLFRWFLFNQNTLKDCLKFCHPSLNNAL